MDIETLNFYKYDRNKSIYNLFTPQLGYKKDDQLATYTVQRGEEMRIDLVGLSMYNNNESILDKLDIIMFINSIDNPVNIVEGLELLYPLDIGSLDGYRITVTDKIESNIVTSQLGVPNKTTRVDSNRKKFIENGYALPPTVLKEAKPSVSLNGNKIIIGGLNS